MPLWARQTSASLPSPEQGCARSSAKDSAFRILAPDRRCSSPQWHAVPIRAVTYGAPELPACNRAGNSTALDTSSRALLSERDRCRSTAVPLAVNSFGQACESSCRSGGTSSSAGTNRRSWGSSSAPSWGEEPSSRTLLQDPTRRHSDSSRGTSGQLGTYRRRCRPGLAAGGLASASSPRRGPCAPSLAPARAAVLGFLSAKWNLRTLFAGNAARGPSTETGAALASCSAR